jgi:hypothetical protein
MPSISNHPTAPVQYTQDGAVLHLIPTLKVIENENYQNPQPAGDTRDTQAASLV